MGVLGEVFGDDVGIGGGDEGLVGAHQLGEGPAAGAVELAKDVIEK